MQFFLPPNPVLAIALILALMKVQSLGRNKSTGIIYAALGDSIAFGTGASGNYGYVCRFYSFLRSKCPMLVLRNLSRPGFTSTNLLLQLRNNPLAIASVKNAVVLTISIGGNNLLRAGVRNYTSIIPSAAEAGIARFNADWSNILNTIRNTIGSNAVIYAMTLYNPFNHEDIAYEKADIYIEQINSTITNPELIEKYNYNIVDAYSLFHAEPNNMWTGFSRIRRDPHPNNEGHEQIALLHENATGL